MADDPLALDADQMRRMGYAVVDLLVRRISRSPTARFCGPPRAARWRP
jgi:hypothetical protein